MIPLKKDKSITIFTEKWLNLRYIPKLVKESSKIKRRECLKVAHLWRAIVFQSLIK